MSAPKNGPPLAESPYRVGRISRARALGYVALVAVGFAAAALVSHAVFSTIDAGVVGAKLHFFAEHKAEFDTIVIGTSLVNYSIAPDLFDATTAADGLKTRTFNFGANGMHPPENFYVLDQVLKTNPRKLKWIVMELDDIYASTEMGNLSTRRVRYWHDWPRTELTLRRAMNFNSRSGAIMKLYYTFKRRRAIALHLSLFLKEFIRLGRGHDALTSAAAQELKENAHELGPKQDGYRFPREAMPPDQARAYERKLARECNNPRDRVVDPAAESAYRDAAARIRAIGAEPIFLVTPTLKQAQLGFRGPPPAPIVSFNDCRRYPQLYESRVRVDEAHMTVEGGNELTRLFAHELVRISRGG